MGYLSSSNTWLGTGSICFGEMKKTKSQVWTNRFSYSLHSFENYLQSVVSLDTLNFSVPHESISLGLVRTLLSRS